MNDNSVCITGLTRHYPEFKYSTKEMMDVLGNKLSEKVKHRDPSNEEPRIKIVLELVNLESLINIFFPIIVIVRNKKRIVKALATTDIIFTVRAILSKSVEKDEKNAPNI